MNIQWNAEGYTRNFSFVHEYGTDLISLIEGDQIRSIFMNGSDLSQ